MAFKCRLCDHELEAREAAGVCSYCGATEPADFVCPAGHYVCETCRTAGAAALVERACSAFLETAPELLAEKLMRHPAFPDHGPAHHLVVAPVVLSCLMAAGTIPKAPARIRSALSRTADIGPGVCGTRGDCGASAGVGALVSSLPSPFLNGRERRPLALEATGRALIELSTAGIGRCCKLAVRRALATARDLFARSLDMPFPGSVTPAPCAFAGRIAECAAARCPESRAETDRDRA